MRIPLPEFIRFGREICGDLAQAEQREWWLADGFGGYAAGTIAQSLTRRYHGLLFAADPVTLARRLLFAKAEVVLIDGEQRHPLTTNHWTSGALEPAGYRLIESFRLEGSTPVWRFEIGDIILNSASGSSPAAAPCALPGISNAPMTVRLRSTSYCCATTAIITEKLLRAPGPILFPQ